MEDRTVVHSEVGAAPSTVKVRTMRSDLASMAKNGGGLPSFQNVPIDGISVEKEYGTPSNMTSTATAGLAVVPTETTVAQTPIELAQEAAAQKNIYPILIVIAVAILAIGGVGYFAYITFFAGTPTQTATLPAVQTTVVVTSSASGAPFVASTTSQPTTTVLSQELSTAHVSLFNEPADQVITISFDNTNATTYRRVMSGSLAAINAASTMIEIDPKAGDGNNLSITGLFSVAGASILNSQTLASFSPDATFFVYRDKSGLWPGYILALNVGQTSSSVMANIKQLETSTNIGNLFLADPGVPSSGGFTSTTISSIPVRTLLFSGSSVPLYFIYGWYKNDLILSTSKNGFSAAVVNLQ